MRDIIFIMGVACSGKTTIGTLLSQRTGLPFFDADNFHPASNKQKMAAGIPLNDEDRYEWLKSLNKLAVEQSDLSGAVIACSALKEKYRDILSKGVSQPVWIFLHGDYDLIHERMKNRIHFMPVELLRSQFDILEIPVSACSIDIKNEPAKIVEMIEEYLKHRQINSQ